MSKHVARGAGAGLVSTSRRSTGWQELSDEELARRCSTDVAGCIDELISRYEARIRDCARRMTLDRDKAEDTVQEIFVRLIVSLPRFERRSAFGTWVYRLAHNTCIDAFRRDVRDGRHRPPAGWSPDSDDELISCATTWGDPVEALDQEIRECYVGWVLTQLPPDYQEIVRLRLGERRSNEEVARVLGTSPDAVKAKLRRARHRMRALLLAGRTCPICGSMGSFRITTTGTIE